MQIGMLDSYFRSFLDVDRFSGSDPSMNGIQVGRRNQEVQKVAFAVDACRDTFHRASVWGADMLFVHHGIYWGRVESVTGALYTRLHQLMEHDLALYAMHLPLDEHMVYGNNAQMAFALGLESLEPFGHYKGNPIGCRATFKDPISLNEVARVLFGGGENTLGVLPFGTQSIGSIGFVSGGGASAIDEAIESGLDLFVTGDAAHTIYYRALESSTNVIFGGHYLTEIWGVKALAEKLIHDHPDIETTFIDVPTGL